MRDDDPHRLAITRRQALVGAVGLSLAGAAAGARAQDAAETARGTVFEDKDGSGQRGPGARVWRSRCAIRASGRICGASRS